MRSFIIISAMLMCILASTDSKAYLDSLMLKIVLLEKKVMEADHDTTTIARLLTEKATLYKSMANYSEALFTLQRIPESALTGSLKCEVHYQKAFNAYMMRAFSLSLQEIWSAQSCGFNEDERAMLYLMVLLENERWDDFRTQYLQQAKGKSFADTISLLQEFHSPKMLDVSYYMKKAGIPGVGLIKAGYTSRGVTNIALQLAFAGFAAYNIYTGFYFTGFFSGVQPMRRFYSGGKILTGSLVRQKNEESINALKSVGYRYVEKLYSR